MARDRFAKSREHVGVSAHGRRTGKQERVASRDAAKAAGRIAQTAFGPDAARARLAAHPIYRTPPNAKLKSDPVPVGRFVAELGVVLNPWQEGLLEQVARIHDVPVAMLRDGRPPAPAVKHLSECYGFADGWGCDPECPVGGSDGR